MWKCNIVDVSLQPAQLACWNFEFRQTQMCVFVTLVFFVWKCINEPMQSSLKINDGHLNKVIKQSLPCYSNTEASRKWLYQSYSKLFLWVDILTFPSSYSGLGLPIGNSSLSSALYNRYEIPVMHINTFDLTWLIIIAAADTPDMYWQL